MLTQAAKCFKFVAEALEAETLEGMVKERVINATKQLVQASGMDANQLLAGLAPETQEIVAFFHLHFGLVTIRTAAFASLSTTCFNSPYPIRVSRLTLDSWYQFF